MSKIKDIKATLKKDTWVKTFLKDNKSLLILVIFLGFMTAFSAAALMFTSGYLISKASTRPYNVLMIYIPVVLTRAFGIARPAFRYVQRLSSHNWVLKMTSKLRLKLFDTVEKSGVFYKEKFQSGKILSILTEDVGHIQNMYLRTIFPEMVALAIYVFILIATGILNIWYGISMFILFFVLLVVGPVLSIILNGSRLVDKKEFRTKLYTKITDNVLGVGDWTVSGQKERFMKNIESEEQHLAEIEKELRQFSRRRTFVLEFVFVLVAVSSIIFAGIYFENSVDRNWIAAFVLCVFPLSDTFVPLSKAGEEMAAHERSIKNVNSLDKHTNDVYVKHVIDKANLSTECAEDVIKINSLEFSYDGNIIAKDIDLSVGNGEKVCILGKSGAGKSTLLKMIRGDITDYSGKITIFGKDVKTTDLGKSRLAGELNQSPWVFNTTIFNNLRLGDSDLTYEKAEEIIKMVGLEKKIKSMEKGLDTIVDEGGKNFSGGERQRVALARILLMDTPVILLDEPTVGLDPVTENELLDTIFDVFREKTIIWVTHHLQGIEKMDRVLYLKDGEFIMDGNPKNLIKNNPFFKKLYDIDKGL